jgi:hypothetical protein
MRYIKKYQIFESNSEDEIVSDLEDIVLDINDLSHWICQVRGGYSKSDVDGSRFTSMKNSVEDYSLYLRLNWKRMIRIRLSLDEDNNNYWNCYNTPPVVTEVFERAIDYMKMSGWKYYSIYLCTNGDQIEDIKLEQIENFDICQRESINIIFTKEPV